MYKGVGSVIVGSAPGGVFVSLNFFSKCKSTSQAAAFFSTYETMKKLLPFSDNLAPVNHMVSASVAEVVRSLHLFDLRLHFHGRLG